MKRAERKSVVCAVLLSILVGAPTIHAAPFFALPLDTEPTTKVHNTVADGTADLVVGFYSDQRGGCDGGTQGFVKKIQRADGTLLWQRYEDAHPIGDCTSHAGLPLFALFPDFDPAYIAASSIHDVAVDDDGTIVAGGEMTVAWYEGEIRLKTDGAFVVRLAGNDGTPVAYRYYGEVPPMGSTPGGGSSCSESCDLDGPGGGEEYGGRGIAIDNAGNVVLTGWYRGPAPGASRDFLLLKFDSNLGLLWEEKIGTPAEDIGQDVVINDNNRIFVTGKGDTNRDLFVVKYRPNGVLKEVFLAGGDCDDEGQKIALKPNGNVLVEGIITEEIDFGGQTVGGPGQQMLQAEITPALNVVQVQAEPLQMMLGMANPPPPPHPAPSPISSDDPTVTLPLKVGQIDRPVDDPQDFDPPPDGQSLELIDVVLLNGKKGTGGVDQLLESDDLYLTVHQDFDSEEWESVKILFLYALPPQPILLEHVRLELKLISCYSATVTINGLAVEEFSVIGQGEYCDDDELTIRVPIPADLAAALGFDGTPLPPDSTLEVVLEVFFGDTCPVGASCADSEQSCSVDDTDAGFVDY